MLHIEKVWRQVFISSTQWQANFEKKSPPLGTAICFLLQQKFYQKTLPLQLLSGRRRATRSTHHDSKNHRETSKQYLTQVRDKHRYSGNPKRKPAHSNPIEDPDDPYDSTAQVFSLIVPDWTSSQDCVGVCMFVCIVAADILIILICM